MYPESENEQSNEEVCRMHNEKETWLKSRKIDGCGKKSISLTRSKNNSCPMRTKLPLNWPRGEMTWAYLRAIKNIRLPSSARSSNPYTAFEVDILMLNENRPGFNQSGRWLHFLPCGNRHYLKVQKCTWVEKKMNLKRVRKKWKNRTPIDHAEVEFRPLQLVVVIPSRSNNYGNLFGLALIAWADDDGFSSFPASGFNLVKVI